jgi:hypothetical protein
LYNRKSKGTGSLEYRKIILADKQLPRNPKNSSIREEQTIIGRTSNMIQPEMATTHSVVVEINRSNNPAFL